MMRRDGLFLLGLLALLAWCYAPGLLAPPAYDDDFGVFQNPTVRGMMRDPKMLARAFRDPMPPVPPGVPMAAYVYRPLTEASFALNLCWPTGPPILVLRLGNLLIHLLAALLVFWIAGQVGPGRGFARWAALLFAAHPLAVPAVTYVYQRSVSLEALLVFLCMGLYWSARQGASRRRYAAALAAGLLAMGAKETAVTLPLMLGAMEWILREPGERWGVVFKRWLPFALLPGIVLVQVLRQSSLLDADIIGFRWRDYALIQPGMVAHYLRLAALPFPLAFYYDRFTYGYGDARVVPVLPALLWGAVLAGLLAWVLFGPRRLWMPRLGLALFLAPLALECTVFPTAHVGWNHRCYPGLLGAGLLFAWGVGKRGFLLGGMVLALMAWGVLGENRLWNCPPDLLGRDVRQAFHDPIILQGYARGYLNRGQPARAEHLARRAVESPWHTPVLPELYIRILLALGRYDQAHRVIAGSLKEFPHDPHILWTALQEAVRVGEPERIERMAGRESLIEVPGPSLAIWLADWHVRRGEPARAEALLRHGLACYPAEIRLRAALAALLSGQGRQAEAEEALRSAGS